MHAKFNAVQLIDPRQTAKEMARLATVYAGDLGELAKLPLPRFFDLVRKLPYRADPKHAETLSRPRYLLEKDYPFRDCDDKAILMGAYCHANGHGFGCYASSTKAGGQLHHVWTVASIKGKDIILDPTYRHHRLGELPQREKITRIEKLIEVPAMQLHTYEGLGFSLSKAVKSVKRKTVSTVKSAVKNTAKAGTQLRKGNVLTAAKLVAKPVPYATTAINSTAKAGTQLRKGNVLTAAKIVGKTAIKPAADVAKAIGRNMPAALKNAVKSAVKKAVGDNVTTTTKALVLPAATAAALAVPGAQPFAAAVPVVVNMALDEIIKEAKSKAQGIAKKAIGTAKAAGAPAKSKSALVASNAKARAAELKARMQAAKQKAGSVVSEVAQEAAQAVAPVAQEAAQEESAKPSKKIMLMAGGGGLLLLGTVLYFSSKKKRG